MRIVRGGFSFILKPTVFRDRHPPKKYHANALETIPAARRDRLSEEITQPERRRSESTEIAGDRRIGWRGREVSGNRTEIRRPVQVGSRRGCVAR